MRKLYLLSFLVSIILFGCSINQERDNIKFGIVIHGGAGTILKTLAPEGQNIITKTNEGTRYYKLDWRDDYGTYGMPFNPKENINNSSV